MPKFRINALALDTFGRLAGVRAYLDLVDRAMPELEFDERRRLEELAREQKWDYGDYDVERQGIDERFKHWIPRFSAYSALILLYSVLEVQLMAVAETVGKLRASPFEVADLRGRSIEAPITFIHRVAGYNAKTQPQWAELSNLRELRNLIVHRVGTRGSSQTHRTTADHLAKQYPGQIVFPPDGQWSYGEAWVAVPLCRTLVDTVEAFFVSLFNALELPTKGAELITM